MTPEQCIAARTKIAWSRNDLAFEAGLSRKTIDLFERGSRTPTEESFAKIRSALQRGGADMSAL